MNGDEREDELLRAYFREKIDGLPARPSRAPARTPARAGVGLWIARVAVAATFLLALGLPFADSERVSPSARAFAQIHERIGTAETVNGGLVAAGRFLRTYFQGERP